jgi:ubiquinone/menaquinone biosynthesis C-methylase UbiE
MADDVRRKTAKGAVGTADPQQWLALGQKQFQFLTSHGLDRHHRLLEIGCGNLRAGWRLIEYLDPGNYTGVDISPEILLAAYETIAERQLQERWPRIFVVDGTNLDFLPDASHHAAHAHSVFTHTPIDVVKSYIESVRRILEPGGFFDFTYHHTDGRMSSKLDEDFYFPTAMLLDIADDRGFDGSQLTDWDYVQEKIRLVKR